LRHPQTHIRVTGHDRSRWQTTRSARPAFRSTSRTPCCSRGPGPDTNHSATADDGSFDSDAGKAPGLNLHKINDYYAVQLPKAGVYTYHRKVHADMTGTITVQALPTGGALRSSGCGQAEGVSSAAVR
jgi:hypothetical protein